MTEPPRLRTRERAARVIQPRGLRRETAALYVGVSASQFSKWVEAGVMPMARVVGGVALWDREALDVALDDLFNPPAPQEKTGWEGIGNGANDAALHRLGRRQAR